MSMDLKDKIRTVPHWPKQGVMFKDISTLISDPEAFRHAIRQMMNHFDGRGITMVAAAESRGFIFGAVLAHELHAGFAMLRKPGKLPYKTIRQDFKTEYSTDAFEIHIDAIKKGDRVLIVDDLLATGGTSLAAAQLIEKLGGTVAGFCFCIDLKFLGGREKLEGYEVFSLID
jgi:adenine phosphoribosyltransferase